MDELDETVLNVAQRQKRAQIMRRYQAKIERAREMAKKRLAPQENIKKRAYAQARQIVRRRVAGKRGAEYEKLGPSEKIAIDRAVEGKQKLIKKIALRLIPRVKQAEQRRLSAFMKGQALQNYGKPEGGSGQSSVQEEINAFFAESFPPMAERSTRKQPTETTDTATKDQRGKPLKGNKSVIQYSKFDEERSCNSSAYKALAKKARKSGISEDILGEVYDRGLDAWYEESGVSQQQYAFARVNSYINQGKTYFNEDADLHEEITLNNSALNAIVKGHSGKTYSDIFNHHGDKIHDMIRKVRHERDATAEAHGYKAAMMHDKVLKAYASWKNKQNVNEATMHDRVKAHPAVQSVDDEGPGDYFVNLKKGYHWSGQRAFGVDSPRHALKMLKKVEKGELNEGTQKAGIYFTKDSNTKLTLHRADHDPKHHMLVGSDGKVVKSFHDTSDNIHKHLIATGLSGSLIKEDVEIDEAIKGWKHAARDINKIRRQQADAANTVEKRNRGLAKAKEHAGVDKITEARLQKPEVGSHHKVDEDGAIGHHVVTGVHDGVVYTQNIKTKEKFDTPLRHWHSSSSPIKEDTEMSLYDKIQAKRAEMRKNPEPEKEPPYKRKPALTTHDRDRRRLDREDDEVQAIIRKKIENVDRDTPHTEHGKQQQIQKKIIDEEGNSQPDPKKRLVGTDSLVKAYKKDTPGQSLDETFSNAFAAGVGVTVTDLGMKAQGGFAYHPSAIAEMEELDNEEPVEEEVRSADVKGVIVRTASGKTVVRKQKVDRKIIGSGNLTDGKPE